MIQEVTETLDAGWIDDRGRVDHSQRLLALYYRAKPLVPRRLQLALRRLYAPRQRRRTFPAWPIEPMLVHAQHELAREAIRRSGEPCLPFINFWPEGRRFAFVLTHDVEGPAGVANIPRVLEVERRHGVVSSWNFVVEDYRVESAVFDSLRAAGCEIGVHGVTHDGSLFRDRAAFEAQLPRIHEALREWGAVGFRSPATHRNADWMPELGCLYDSSFPDTDPFEPQPGGCCSIFPFFLSSLVELPITLPQDHTIWEILREPTIELWLRKSEWLATNHGLINVLTHPDYMIRPERLERYGELLAFLTGQNGGWHALPRDVAAWWRVRSAMAEGRGSDHRATIALAREQGSEIVFDTDSEARFLPGSGRVNEA
jgi:peptidoglycan/xylan/chitin deacetylase (PgdA/CDA1 family)